MDRPAAARDLWKLLEPIHVVTYFSPEPLAALKEAGYRGFWMGYFAGRAAPLGPAPAALVESTFYNFSRDHIDRAIPDAWQFAPPAAALAAREQGSVATLSRMLGADLDGVDRAAELAGRAARTAPVAARPLYAANQALPEPEGALARLWHAATLLREHRGDGHLIALAAAEVDGRQSHALHGLASDTPPDVYRAARNLDESEWSRLLGELGDRGWVSDGALSESGLAAKAELEQLTDRLAASAYEVLDDAEIDELIGLLRPITRAVIAAGELPAKTPVGLDFVEGEAQA